MDFSRLTTYLDTLESRYGIPGADIKITQRYNTVYRHMNGYSDYAKTKPVSPHDLYDIYSCSKVITMIGVMQLIEHGQLDLMDPLEKYLPEFSTMQYATDFTIGEFPISWPTATSTLQPAHNTIYIHDLMSMTAGLSYDISSKPIQDLVTASKGQANTREIVSAMAKMPLLCEPGTRYSYSLGHDVLAAVVEVITQKTFGQYMNESIFEPLDITDMYYQLPDNQHHRLSAQYAKDRLTGEIKQDNSMLYRITHNYESGGAGLTTSVDSYSKVVEALANNGVASNGKQILSQTSIDVIRMNWLTRQELLDFSKCGKTGYGYGLGVRTLIDNSKSKSPIGEFGWDGAAGAYTLIDPTNHISIFYTHEILGMLEAYSEIHPTIRDLTYDALGL